MARFRPVDQSMTRQCSGGFRQRFSFRQGVFIRGLKMVVRADQMEHAFADPQGIAFRQIFQHLGNLAVAPAQRGFLSPSQDRLPQLGMGKIPLPPRPALHQMPAQSATDGGKPQGIPR